MPSTQTLFTDARQLLEDLQISSSTTPQLHITIRATHSGYLLNGRVYPGSGVRDGAGSWLSIEDGGTAGYSKPILLHHDDRTDAIGRVISQKFIQLWHGPKFENDWKTPEQGINPGSGLIILGADILDQDAQQKILDGRYKTVSTGQTSDQLNCSICGADWIKTHVFMNEMPCDHRPGETYEIDDKIYQCYFVTGLMDYLECSFVNIPANELAQVISNDITSDLKEDKQGDLNWASVDESGNIASLKLIDTKNGKMTELIKKEGEKDELPYKSENCRGKPIISVPEGTKIPNKSQNIVDDKDNDAPEDNSTASTQVSDSEMVYEEFALAHIAKSLQDAGILNDKELDEDECNISFEECIELIGQLKDAKLSGEQRKKLKSSSFCGPNRSFPVPDCAHVTAARRLIGRAKVSSATKKRILACVNRKSKAMGCDENKDSLSRKVKSAMSDEPKKTQESEDTQTEDKALGVLQTALEDAQAKISTLEAELAKSKQLYDAKVNEYNSLLDENSALLTDYQRQLAFQYVQLQVQLGKPTVKHIKDTAAFEEAVGKLADRTIDSLRDSISDALPELNNRFKQQGLPTFIKDKSEGKPATQKSIKPESGSKSKSKDDKKQSVEDLL